MYVAVNTSQICPGIGRAVVKALAECDAEVIAFSRTLADLDSLKQEVSWCIRGLGCKCTQAHQLRQTSYFDHCWPMWA